MTDKEYVKELWSDAIIINRLSGVKEVYIPSGEYSVGYGTSEEEA